MCVCVCVCVCIYMNITVHLWYIFSMYLYVDFMQFFKEFHYKK